MKFKRIDAAEASNLVYCGTGAGVVPEMTFKNVIKNTAENNSVINSFFLVSVQSSFVK